MFVIRPRGAAIGLFIVAGLFAPVMLLAFVGAVLQIREDPSGPSFRMAAAMVSIGVALSLIPFLVGMRFLARATPVVPGAPPPAIRYAGDRLEEGPRSCRFCGQVANCKKVTANKVNGIPTGTEWQFACPCGRAFTIESTWSTLIGALATATCLSIGGALLYQAPPDAATPSWSWAALVFGVVMSALGVFAGSQCAVRVYYRLKCRRVAAT